MGKDACSAKPQRTKKPARKAAASTGTPTPKKRGRQDTYNSETADLICARLSDGEPLREICRDETMPAWRTVYNWQEAHPDFAARIARAREMGEEAIAQDCLKIADDGSNDTYVDEEGRKRVDHDHIQRSKLRIDTRLKLLAKWNPRKWGEKVDLNHGGQKDNPLTMLLEQVQGTPLRPKGDE